MNLHKFPLRLILSVIAGIITSIVLSVITHEMLHACGVFPPMHKPMFDTLPLLIVLFYHSVFCVAGAFVTAMFAKDQAKKAVLFLGTKGTVIWLLGAIFLWKHHPTWFNIAKAITEFPFAILGGYLYSLYHRKKQQAAKPAVS